MGKRQESSVRYFAVGPSAAAGVEPGTPPASPTRVAGGQVVGLSSAPSQVCQQKTGWEVCSKSKSNQALQCGLCCSYHQTPLHCTTIRELFTPHSSPVTPDLNFFVFIPLDIVLVFPFLFHLSMFSHVDSASTLGKSHIKL